MEYFLGLITRCKDEFFIKDFCYYYLTQGVDILYIIDDDSNDKSIYNDINNDKIKIIYEKNIMDNKIPNKLYQKIKNDFEWIIYCDVDEFITTKKNINNTIKDELKTTFKDVDCIKIPWVMMSCNGIKNNPKNILLENIYRWNHNNKHPHPVNKFRCRYKTIECKCIFKPNKFNDIYEHNPLKPIKKPKVVDSVYNSNNQLSCYCYNFREKHINIGYLLCYHYRIISEENCINKLKNNKWYIDDGYTLNDLMSSDNPEIIDKTLHYKFINNNLKFIHIPKTSGTYIENLGKEKNILWGRFDNNLLNSTIKDNQEIKSNWLAPLGLFKEFPYDFRPIFFTIVRNPYDRIISKCFCKFNNEISKDITTKDDFNNYIKEQVTNTYFFLPQHLYTHNNDKQIVDYIIKYENADKGFNILMDKYKCDIKYIKQTPTTKKFNIKDISKENINLINKIYEKDFQLYNYHMII